MGLNVRHFLATGLKPSLISLLIAGLLALSAIAWPAHKPARHAPKHRSIKALHRKAMRQTFTRFDGNVPPHIGNIRAVRQVPLTLSDANGPVSVPGVEIELYNPEGFPGMNEAFVLRIGNQQSSIARYPDDGEITTLIFSMPADAFAHTTAQDAVTVQYGDDESRPIWHFGRLGKWALRGNSRNAGR